MYHVAELDGSEDELIDEPAPQPTNIYDELLNKHVADKQERIEELADAYRLNAALDALINPPAYTPQVDAWQDPYQYGEHGNLEHVRDISIYCNPAETKISIGDDIVYYIYGKFDCVHSLKYGAYYEVVNGEPRFWTNPCHLNSDKFDFRDADRWNPDDWFDIMIERGACIIGDEPADDFNAQLDRLRAAAKVAHDAEDAARRQRDIAEDAYNKANEFYRDAHLDAYSADVAVDNFFADKAKELRDKILDDVIFNAHIAIIAQGGKRFDEPEFEYIKIRGSRGRRFFVHIGWNVFAEYDTPAQVTAAINLLRDAIERGATEFKFPTIDEINKPPTPTFEIGKAYYKRDWLAYAAATSTKPYYVVKRTNKFVFVAGKPDCRDTFRYMIRRNSEGEYFLTFDGEGVYAEYNA